MISMSGIHSKIKKKIKSMIGRAEYGNSREERMFS